MVDHNVHIEGTTTTFAVSPGDTVLAAALRAGIDLPYECTEGCCGSCRVRIDSGSIHYDAPPVALTKEEQAAGYMLTCQAHPDRDIVISRLSGGEDLPAAVHLKASVGAIDALTDNIYKLVLRLPQDALCDYRAGQHLNIESDGSESHSFSMASAYPFGNEIELHIRRIPGGQFTDKYLSTAACGSELEIDIPRGEFYYHERDWRPILCVATGTGIAPIHAILESLLDNEECPPVTLYWGMRTESDLYLRTELESWGGRLFEYSFRPVLSAADSKWNGRRGHVQDAILGDFEDLSEYALYVCGAPEMVADVKHLASQRGADLKYIYSDSFTTQHRTLT
ncbi:MAG TPA: 2Fe-2S iron-sulfur cluster-binding protein [Nevskiaceae bacterium]|nr:2Fe-2S iron-sulfur cluster-binding protein [Nevskiaceae bacterium]